MYFVLDQKTYVAIAGPYTRESDAEKWVELQAVLPSRKRFRILNRLMMDAICNYPLNVEGNNLLHNDLAQMEAIRVGIESCSRDLKAFECYHLLALETRNTTNELLYRSLIISHNRHLIFLKSIRDQIINRKPPFKITP